jgi:hypothetical protein
MPRDDHHYVCVAIADWLRQRGYAFLHTPNEGKRSMWAARRLRREGMSAGVPDFLLLSRAGGKPWVHVRGIAVEVKVGRDRLSPAQRDWFARLHAAGWAAIVARSLDDTVRYIAQHEEDSR